MAARIRPARFGERAVHVPFEVADVVLARELIEHAEDVLLHVAAGQVEDHLVAQLAARTVGEMDHPIGMRAIEVAIGVHHLGLDPKAEVHAEPVDVFDQRLEALREFLRIDEPVAQAGAIVVALAEPAVIHHEQLDSEFGGASRPVPAVRLRRRRSRSLPRNCRAPAAAAIRLPPGRICSRSKRCSRREAPPKPVSENRRRTAGVSSVSPGLSG